MKSNRENIHQELEAVEAALRTFKDEAQDISICQLRLLASFAKKQDTPFFAGDVGQRIFQQPFSWKSIGVDIRGRFKTLNVITGLRTRSGSKQTNYQGRKFLTWLVL